MRYSPFLYQYGRAPRKSSVDDFERFNTDLRLKLAILRVKVWWRVFIPIHLDDDSVERAQRRHFPSLRISLAQLAYECNLTESSDQMRTALMIGRERTRADCKAERDSWHNRGN